MIWLTMNMRTRLLTRLSRLKALNLVSLRLTRDVDDDSFVRVAFEEFQLSFPAGS
jgi:hypothetical protein